MNEQGPSPEVLRQAQVSGLQRGQSFSYSNEVQDTPERKVTFEQVEAFVHAIARNSVNETHAWNLWNTIASDFGPIREALEAVWGHSKPGVTHFAPWGAYLTSCGLAYNQANATDRRSSTTCADCRSRFTNHLDSEILIAEAKGYARDDEDPKAKLIRKLTDALSIQTIRTETAKKEVENWRRQLSMQADSTQEEIDRADKLATREAEFVKLANIYLNSSDAEKWPVLAERLQILVDEHNESEKSS